MSSLGTGISCIYSVGTSFTMVSEKQCLAQSLVRRLISPRGSLKWSPTDGTDLRDFLNHAQTPTGKFALEQAAKNECEKDDRVQSAQATSVMNSANGTCQLTIKIVTANGPFDLVLLVESLTVSLLSVS